MESRGRGSASSTRRPAIWWSSLLAAVLLAGAVSAQTAAEPPADIKAALKQADAGDPKEILRLAEAGRPDAQYYAAVMLIYGRGGGARDPVRGCALAEKASVVRADATHLVGECYRTGLPGKVDADKAKAAFARASEMGFVRSKCALGEMLLAEPAAASRGLALCTEAATGGDVEAQLKVARIYRSGGPVKANPAEARKWYEKAASQQNAEASRKLGEMYAAGEGGKRDAKKALGLWQVAEKGGDPLAPILVADQLFSDLTGGRKPGPGKYKFRGGIPVADFEVVEQWYREALARDPRPEVKIRAQSALDVLGYFKTAARSTGG